MSEPRKRRYGYLIVIVLTAIATVGVLFLLENIWTRKREAESVVFSLVDIDETVVDPALWGKNFPRQYDGYKRTVDMQRTRYGGSEADPHAPDVTTSNIEADPRLKTMWAGYAFAIDFREERGHAFMLLDQRETERVRQFKQPGACLHCHASIIDAYREVGIKGGAPGDLKQSLTSPDGMKQLMAGFEKVCAMPYAEATKMVEHPVACIDCHDPKNMQLRVTRPGFINGIAELAKSSDPLPHLPSIERWRTGDKKEPYDANALATRQEMRSFVCGQCHVEYYFKGEGKLLTYPWHNGLKVQQIEKYYDDEKYKDWTHALTGANVLKAQHPEFETWSQGIHARSGVSCADCHMPYKREGAIKISEHQIRSPLLNISTACQTCHRTTEAELLARATTIQDRTRDVMSRAQDALNDLILAIQSAKANGASDERLASARALQRKAQFRVDFVNAENSMGFHADQETARTLAEAIDYARQGLIELLKSPASNKPVVNIEAALKQTKVRMMAGMGMATEYEVRTSVPIDHAAGPGNDSIGRFCHQLWQVEDLRKGLQSLEKDAIAQTGTAAPTALLDGWGRPMRYYSGRGTPPSEPGMVKSVIPYLASAGPDGDWGTINTTTGVANPSATPNGPGAEDNIYSFDLE